MIITFLHYQSHLVMLSRKLRIFKFCPELIYQLSIVAAGNSDKEHESPWSFMIDGILLGRCRHSDFGRDDCDAEQLRSLPIVLNQP